LQGIGSKKGLFSASCRFRKPYPIDSRSVANQNIIAA